MRKGFILCLMISFLSLFSLSADLKPYLKKIEDKGDHHKMRNIDFIYVINLDQRPEKFASCVAQLEPYGIFPYRFSAVNGWELPLEVINDVGVKLTPNMKTGHMGTIYTLEGGGVPQHEKVTRIGQNYFSHCLSRGCVGIVLSHLSILQDAYDSGYETIWIMEDDIEVIKDPHLLSDYIDKMNQMFGETGWDVLFTDRDTKNQEGNYVPCSAAAWRPNFNHPYPFLFQQKKNVSPEFRKIGARYGAYSMIVNRAGMKKLLDFFHTYSIFLPYDIDFISPVGIKLFTVREDVVSTLIKAFSDNGSPRYKEKN